MNVRTCIAAAAALALILPAAAQAPISDEDASAAESSETDAPAADGADAAALPEVRYDPEELPEPVRRTREAILEAARSGDIERMRPVVEANELPPTFSFGSETDPIAFWKEAAGDDAGREVLALMIEILEAGYVRLHEGTPQEMYVWPYFYAVPFDRLTPAQEVELYKLIPPHDVEEMAHVGSYVFYRFGIGPDGTWHFFVSGD